MAAGAIFGSISELDVETEQFTEWVERLEQWFLANLIDDADRKRALFLSLIGAKGYKLIRSLAQNEPAKKSYDALKKLMLDHLQPKPNEIAQRYVFYKRDRRVGESVKDYVAELRKLSEHCEFGENLEENLRDKLVCGLNDEKIQQKLLAIRGLNLQRAIDTAVAIEAAARSHKELVSVGQRSSKGLLEESAYKMDHACNKGMGKRECYRCEVIGIWQTFVHVKLVCHKCKMAKGRKFSKGTE